jgi:hypothetical protein
MCREVSKAKYSLGENISKNDAKKKESKKNKSKKV